MNLDFWPAEKIEASAKWHKAIPLSDVDESLKKKLAETVARVMQSYLPEKGERKLRGIFLYSNSMQDKYLSNSFGVCLPIGKKDALIGITTQLLADESEILRDLVFLHEMAHLTEIEHNERFMDRNNTLMVAYFTEHKTRLDSVDTMKRMTF